MRLRTRLEAFAWRIWAGERGSSIVEFALVLPIAMVVFTGLLQFGVCINKSLELQNSTSLAGQYLSLSRQPTGTAWNPCSVTVSAFQSVSPYLNMSNVTFSFVFTTPTGTVGSYPNTTTCSGGVTEMVQGATAQVAVLYPCSLAIYGMNLMPGCHIRAQVTEVIQ